VITLAEQLKEALRELALRRRVYPGFVQRGKMTEGQAAYHIAAMEAIVQTLERLEAETRQPSLF
jgi:hypothetical protein